MSVSLCELPKLDPPVGALTGSRVAVSDDRAVFAAEGDDALDVGNPNCNSGAAHVFELTGATWSQKAILKDSTLTMPSECGERIMGRYMT